MHTDRVPQLFDAPLDIEMVIVILTNDIPAMTERQLAELLANLYFDGPAELRDPIAPLARAELARRRFVSYVEGIVAAL